MNEAVLYGLVKELKRLLDLIYRLMMKEFLIITSKYIKILSWRILKIGSVTNKQ